MYSQDSKKIAVFFPGGGTQYVGMGKGLYDHMPVARHTFEEASDALGYDIGKICFDGPFDILSDMQYAQPAIFTTSVAAFRVAREEIGISPHFLAGHSQGEYAALVCAGAMDFGHGIRLISKRGELLQRSGRRSQGTMMAVSKVRHDIIENLIEEADSVTYLSAYNSPLQHVVSGRKKDIDTLAGKLAAEGAEVNILDINTPSHCPLNEDAAAEMKEILGSCPFTAFSVPVISNVNALPYPGPESVPDLLARHMVCPVYWQQSVSYIISQGINCMIDVGPKAVLKNLAAFISPGIKAFSLDIREDLDALTKELTDRDSPLEQFIKTCLVFAVSTRNYNTDEQAYHEGVVKSYERLKAIREGTVVQTSAESLAAECATLTMRILAAKKHPLRDQYAQMLSRPGLVAAPEMQ